VFVAFLDDFEAKIWSKWGLGGVARRGEARRGEARRSEARRGEARRGEARSGEAGLVGPVIPGGGEGLPPLVRGRPLLEAPPKVL